VLPTDLHKKIPSLESPCPGSHNQEANGTKQLGAHHIHIRYPAHLLQTSFQQPKLQTKDAAWFVNKSKLEFNLTMMEIRFWLRKTTLIDQNNIQSICRFEKRKGLLC